MPRCLAPLSIVAFVVVFLSGCGYGLAGRGNPWGQQGVHKVYVKTLTNNTLRPGIEVPFTGALLKEFARGKRLIVVTEEKEADALIYGTVDSVSSSIGPMTTVAGVSQDPEAQALSDMVIASEYNAAATMTVQLVKYKDNRLLWSQSFTRTKAYPGNNRFGLIGSTSSLINASQEQLAFNEIAQFLASDAYDTMMEAF